MRTPVACSAVMLLLAAGGCLQRPAPVAEPAVFDPAFARGCWVEKGGENGKATAFLRLLGTSPRLSGHVFWTKPRFLPDYLADASSITINLDPGGLDLSPQRQSNGGDIVPASKFSIGFNVVSAGPDEMIFARSQTGDTLHIKGADDRLTLYMVANIGLDEPIRMHLFDGERDGCD